MKRPLIISDCDEVLLHMIVPFQTWLLDVHHIDFDLTHGDWGQALRHKHDGTQVMPDRVWELLNAFFDNEMARQYPINGAVEATARLAQHADIVILTNLLDHRTEARTEQLRTHGIDAPVYTNQGGKGRRLAQILTEFDPSVAIFIDDLPTQHESVAKHCPHVWRLHMVGEPLVAAVTAAAPHAHARIDLWQEAESWIAARLSDGDSAPMIDAALTGIEPHSI